MAKKPVKAKTTCEQGGAEKLPDQITVAKGDTITFESWVCNGAGVVWLWIDEKPSTTNPTMTFTDQSTGPTPLALESGTHELTWMLASPSAAWQWRSQITTADPAGVARVRVLHRMKAPMTAPSAKVKAVVQ